MFEIAGDFHKNKIRAMYEEIFHDPADFTEYYFAERFIPERVIISRADDRSLMSMLSRNGKSLAIGDKSFKADYIYAVAVDEAYRGQGISKAMVDKSVELSAEEGTAFTYLIPVDERIYTGNGFVTVRNEQAIKVYARDKFKENLSCREVFLGENDDFVKELVTFTAEYGKNCIGDNVIITLKDEMYFKTMLRQFQVEGSRLIVLYNDSEADIAAEEKKSDFYKSIIGYAVVNTADATKKDDRLEDITICDYVCNDESKEDFFNYILKYFNAESGIINLHPIMVKLTSPEFLENIHSAEDRCVLLRIKDTDKLYSIKSSEGQIFVTEIFDDLPGEYSDVNHENAEEYNKEYNNISKKILSVTLNELTEYIFGMIDIEGMLRLKHITGIMVNEEV